MSEEKTNTFGDGVLLGLILGAVLATLVYALLSRVSDYTVRSEALAEGKVLGRNEAITYFACQDIADEWPEKSGWNVSDKDCNEVDWGIYADGKYLTLSEYKRKYKK